MHTIGMITILVVCIILFGVNFKVYFDSNKMTARIELRILSRFDIYKINYILFDSKIYFSINGRAYKRLLFKRKNTKKRFVFYKRLKIDKLSYTLVLGDETSSINTIFSSNTIAFLTEYLPLLLEKYVKIDRIEKNILPKFDESGFKILVDFFVKGKGIYSLAYNLIANKLPIKKEVNYANWQTNW